MPRPSLSSLFLPDSGIQPVYSCTPPSRWNPYGRTDETGTFHAAPLTPAHDGGAVITDPDADIPNTFPWVDRKDFLGNYFLFGLLYPADLTAVSAALVLSIFGNSDDINTPGPTLDGYSALQNLAATGYDITITPDQTVDPIQPSGVFGTDATISYRLTRTSKLLHSFDPLSFRRFLPTVKTALAATFSGSGSVSQAILLIKGF